MNDDDTHGACDYCLREVRYSANTEAQYIGVGWDGPGVPIIALWCGECPFPEEQYDARATHVMLALAAYADEGEVEYLNLDGLPVVVRYDPREEGRTQEVAYGDNGPEMHVALAEDQERVIVQVYGLEGEGATDEDVLDVVRAYVTALHDRLESVEGA